MITGNIINELEAIMFENVLATDCPDTRRERLEDYRKIHEIQVTIDNMAIGYDQELDAEDLGLTAFEYIQECQETFNIWY